jgi:hypothetical protein
VLQFLHGLGLSGALLAAVLFLGRPSSALGDFEVVFDHGGAPITLDAKTQKPTLSEGESTAGTSVIYSVGQITFLNLIDSPNGFSDGFNISATIVGSNSPATSTAAAISLSRLSNKNQSSGRGTLSIISGDTGSTAPTGKVTLTGTTSALAFGTNASNVADSFISYLETTNTQFGEQSSAHPIDPAIIAASTSESGNTYSKLDITHTPYSIPEVEKVSLGGGDRPTVVSSETDVFLPSPSGLALVLAAVPFLGAVFWRRSLTSTSATAR